MWPLIHAKIAGAIVGICAVLLHLTGPDMPPDPSADPVVTRGSAGSQARDVGGVQRTRGDATRRRRP